MGRDNIAGTTGSLAKRSLLPGMVIQWLMYMTPSGPYASVRQSSRLARSPLMTWLYAIAFWLAAVVLLLMTLIRIGTSFY